MRASPYIACMPCYLVVSRLFTGEDIRGEVTVSACDTLTSGDPKLAVRSTQDLSSGAWTCVV